MTKQLIGLTAVLGRAPSALAQGGGHMNGYGMMGWGYGMGWWGGILMILFWAVVIAGVVYLVKWIAAQGEKKGPPPGPPESALDILNKRYAKGEISKEDYERIKKDIS